MDAVANGKLRNKLTENTRWSVSANLKLNRRDYEIRRVKIGINGLMG
jgi:hypothetical protein